VLFLQVEIPKILYKGHMPMILVSMKIPATTKRTIANVPEITFVKYNIAMIIAIIILINLSCDPMFFFITSDLG